MLEPNLQKKFLLNDFSASHLSTILSNIDSPDPMVANTWLETLLDILKVLPKDSIVSKILPFSIAKGQKPQSVESKLASIKILSNICHFLEDEQLLKDILPLVRSLSEDEETEVRVTICTLFNLIYVKLDSQFLESGYYNLLLELFHDKSLDVRDEVFVVCVEMISLFYNEDFIKNIFKKCKDHVEAAIDSEPKLLPQVAKNLCVLAAINEDVPIINDKIWFIDCYIKLIHVTDENIIRLNRECSTPEAPTEDDDLHTLYLQCRINLASSFEFMARLCTSLNQIDLLRPFLEKFAQDSYATVRQKITEKFGQIAPYFKENSSLIFDILNQLLKDAAIEVIKSLVSQIADVLQVLYEKKLVGPFIDSERIEELCNSLIQCESKIFSETLSWQLYESLMDQFTSFPTYFPSSLIYNCFCKLFFERMTLCRALPSRLACTRTLLVFLRHNINSKQCNEIRRQLIDLSYSDNFYERMLYVKTCSIILDLFSSSYFKTYFLPSIFRLANDKVANIRLAIVFLLPQIITVIRLNNSSFDPLENILTKLRKDTDSEIRYQMELLDSFDSTHLPPSFIKEDIRKYQEEELLSKKEDAEPAVTTNLSFANEPKKHRWSVLSRNNKIHNSSPKIMTIFSSTNNRCPVQADTEMEFMIDAGVSFSKTVSSRIPTIKIPAEHYNCPPSFPYYSHIPIVSTAMSHSSDFSPLVYHLSCDRTNPNIYFSVVDGLNRFQKAFARSNNLLTKFAPLGRAQVRPRPRPPEKVTIKSNSSIPKSKIFSISNTRNETTSCDRSPRRPSNARQVANQQVDFSNSFSRAVSPTMNNKNGNSSFFNDYRDVQFASSSSFSSKSNPKVQLRVQPPLISIYGTPRMQPTSQSFSQSGLQSYSEYENSNLNPLPHPRFCPPENVIKQKKYSSRLPVRSTKRDNHNNSQQLSGQKEF